MMHIGSYLFHFPKPCGTSFAAGGLSKGLAQLGYKVTLYCCGSEEVRAEDQIASRSILRFAGGNFDHPFRVPEDLLERLRRNADKLDLLLIHGNFNPRNVAIARAARFGGIPYIVCPSSFYHAELFRKNRAIKVAYGLLFERPMLRAALAIQVFAESQRNVLRHYGVQRPIFVSPNGFNPSEVPSFVPKVETGLVGDPKILYLGRIDLHTKGLDLLFRGLSMGIREGRLASDLQINLVGPDWGDQRRLEQLASDLGISSNVVFFGRVDDRWPVIFSSDILILTSRHDSFPTTVVESMAAGKPVILSENTGVSEDVKQHGCGFIVKPDAESIRDGLVEALSQRHRWQEMGARGKDFARRSLNWETIAQNAAEHYEKLLGATELTVAV